MLRKKPRRPLADDFVSYLIEYQSWQWHYSFGIGDPDYQDDRYLEFRHLHVIGKLIKPDSFELKPVELTLMPEIARNPPIPDNQPSVLIGVGSLRSRDGEITGLISIPHDALTPILQVLTRGKLRFLTLNGTRMRYRKCLIRSLALECASDQPDLLPEV